MGRRFDDRVIVITGAGNGLGRQYALLLAGLGAKVVVNDYGGDTNGNAGTAAVAEGVVAEIEAAGGTALADGTDVRLADAGDRLVARALDAWGRIDGVINNAGATSGGGSIVEAADADFDLTLGIHLGGTVRLARAVWPHFVARGYGRIVNTSSDSIFGTPSATYVTAKGAIFGLTRALATEGEGHGITVNAVMPSAWTRMTARLPPGDLRDTVEREYRPERIAPLVALLVHPDCRWNGESFQVGANRTARIFLGVTRGYHVRSNEPIDELAEHAAEIVDTDDYAIPANMLDSVANSLALVHAVG